MNPLWKINLESASLYYKGNVLTIPYLIHICYFYHEFNFGQKILSIKDSQRKKGSVMENYRKNIKF